MLSGGIIFILVKKTPTPICTLIILKTEKVLNRLFDYCFSVILYVLIVSLPHLPNTSSTITPSSNTSAAVSDNILSTTATTLRGESASSLARSRMFNPCIGRGHSTATSLSDEERQFLSTSLWRKCLAECNLTLSEEADALVQLVTQSGELQETFNSFKDRFVSKTIKYIL